MDNKPKQNEISQNYLLSRKSDLADREQIVLKDASSKTGFKPEKIYYKSTWWTSKEFGAITYKGHYQGKKAIIKLQGVKPNVSEINMLQSFEKNNKSKIIRPPYLYNYLEWDENLKYEALILEDVGHKKIINTLTNKKEVEEFFNLYKDYRKNCLRSPWVAKPTKNLSTNTINSFKSWKNISFDLYPNHPLRKKEDLVLIEKAIKILFEHFKQIEPEFMHGHFSAGDLVKVGNQIVLRSNLYWSWRNPLRDAVFAYHWFFLDLHKIENISNKIIDEQRKMWLNEIDRIPQNKEEEKLIKLAFLERSTASLNLDALSIDPQKDISKYLVAQIRKDVIHLTSELEDLSKIG